MVYKDQSEPQIKRRRNEECIIKQKYSVRTSSSPQCVVRSYTKKSFRIEAKNLFNKNLLILIQTFTFFR